MKFFLALLAFWLLGWALHLGMEFSMLAVRVWEEIFMAVLGGRCNDALPARVGGRAAAGPAHLPGLRPGHDGRGGARRGHQREEGPHLHGRVSGGSQWQG